MPVIEKRPGMIFRPGHQRQRLALMPVLPARLAGGFFRNDRGAGLASPSLEGGWEEVLRRLLQPGLKLSDPLPRPLQFRPRLRQLTAQRHRQRREHLR